MDQEGERWRKSFPVNEAFQKEFKETDWAYKELIAKSKNLNSIGRKLGFGSFYFIAISLILNWHIAVFIFFCLIFIGALIILGRADFVALKARAPYDRRVFLLNREVKKNLNISEIVVPIRLGFIAHDPYGTHYEITYRPYSDEITIEHYEIHNDHNSKIGDYHVKA